MEQRLGASVGETQPGDPGAGVGDQRVVDRGEGLRGADRVVAESLDAEQAPVGRDADLPQGGQISQPFPDTEVAGVVDGRLGAQRLPVLVVLLDCAARRSVVSPIE
ncbi:MAG: hypothetical protein LC808_17040 [Actinobacteria bacterium]|nr:hypothetical protein [Actinomycetota bacterium]